MPPQPSDDVGVRTETPADVADPDADLRADADTFAALFGAAYLRFHRRDAKRSQLGGGGRAVLQHLAMSGPLTVGEAARHLDRAQSVVSDIVTHLADKGFLEREPDPDDRRRTLVWLTAAGHEALRHDREVLSRDLLMQAMATMPTDRRRLLLSAMRELVDADAAAQAVDPKETP